jgi:toxin ParE1/3/4
VAHRVYFRPRAEADLVALYDYIARQVSTRIAGEFIDRIEAACMSLAHVPERGTKRDDILPGLRTFGFERSTTIAFRVLKTRVEIVTIAYGGRDFESALRKGK